jgi:putative Holliday junction resolvase
MAMPVATLNASENNINEVISFAQEFGAQLIYVGKPISLNENVTSSTLLAEEFANRLAMQWEQPVRLLDERLTTVSATNTLQVNGKNSKEGRSIIDQVAAVILLDHACWLLVQYSYSFLVQE